MIIDKMDIIDNSFMTEHDQTSRHKILHTIGKMEMASPCFGKPNSDEHCVDYLKLPRLTQLSKKINSRIPLDRVRPSVREIEKFLIDMSKHWLKTRPYKDHTFVHKYPIEDSFKRAIDFQSCVITSEGVYIHMHHIRANLQDQFCYENEYDIPSQTWIDEDTPWKAKNCPTKTVIGAEIIRMVYENENLYVEDFKNASGHDDYNYFKMLNLKKLCKEIAHQFEIEHPVAYCNVHRLDIERFFHDLKKNTFYSRSVKVQYEKKAQDANGTVNYKCSFNKGLKRAFAACVITPDAVYLHTRFFLEQQDLKRKGKKRPRETSDLHVKDLETRSDLARKRLKGVKEQLTAIQGLSSSLKNQVGIIEESICVCLEEK
jgi:hypothetical protein